VRLLLDLLDATFFEDEAFLTEAVPFFAVVRLDFASEPGTSAKRTKKTTVQKEMVLLKPLFYPGLHPA
jgi:hypothetical protein